MTPLIWAAFEGHAQEVELLLQAGAVLDIQDKVLSVHTWDGDVGDNTAI